ncbi:MAG: HPF/RaiA family ribosome-associated protein [Clostridiales bacterium]|nr:HPF/RaiA family ribosome-associated protein [Clostridiales bacterium]
MKLEIFGKNYEPSDLLKSVTEKKCEKLARRFSDDEHAQVRFNVVFENGLYTTNLVVTSRGQTYRAETQSASPFDNLDIVIPKLLGQMKKQKDVWERSKKGSAPVYADMRVREDEE